MAGYKELSDDDKLSTAIKFVAVGQPMPQALIEFLKQADLYDLIVTPSTFEVNDGPNVGNVTTPDN